jgi:hypothetical protein
MLAVCCALGGPIVNKLGTKWALVIGACSFPIRGSSYYCNSKFGNQWYLILGGFFTGIGTGTWLVSTRDRLSMRHVLTLRFYL